MVISLFSSFLSQNGYIPVFNLDSSKLSVLSENLDFSQPDLIFDKLNDKQVYSIELGDKQNHGAYNKPLVFSELQVKTEAGWQNLTEAYNRLKGKEIVRVQCLLLRCILCTRPYFSFYPVQSFCSSYCKKILLESQSPLDRMIYNSNCSDVVLEDFYQVHKISKITLPKETNLCIIGNSQTGVYVSNLLIR